MSAIVRRHARTLALLAVHAAVPAALLVVLAVLSGLVRTTALGAFGLIAGLRAVLLALDWLGERTPSPSYRLGVSG